MAKATARTNDYKDPHKLKNHHLNIKIYGGTPPSKEFIESVREHGVLQQLLITPDDVVIAGHQRMKAARIAGLKEVPVCVVRDITDPLEIERLLIVSNRQREKDNETLAREAAHLKAIEETQAEIREKAGKKASPDPAQHVAQGSPGRTAEKVGEAIGVSAPSAAKLAETGEALEAAEASGNTEKAESIKAGLGKSIAAGHRAATADTKPEPPKDKPPEEPKDESGSVIPKKHRDVFAKRAEFLSLARKLTEVEKACAALSEDDAGRYMHFNAIKASLADAKRHIKGSAPYSGCPYCKWSGRKGSGDCQACKGAGWVNDGIYKQAPEEMRAGA